MTIRVVGVADGKDATLITSRDGLDGSPEPRWYSASLIQDDEHKSPVDALESRLRVVRWLATHSDQASTHEPSICPLNDTRKAGSVVESTDFLPEDGMDLIEGRRRGDDHRLVSRMDVYPPRCERGGQKGLAEAVSALYRGTAVDHDRLGNFPLERPEVDVSPLTGPRRGVGGIALSANPGRKTREEVSQPAASTGTCTCARHRAGDAPGWQSTGSRGLAGSEPLPGLSAQADAAESAPSSSWKT